MSVSGFKAAHLRQYLAEHYRPGAMVVAAAGAIDHEKLVRHVEALFGGLTPAIRGEEISARYVGGAAWSKKPFEQSHIVIGVPSPSYGDPAFYTAQVFSGLFGGGMSSRLFQEIREDRGLCYSIYSSVWGLRDTGMLAVHAATAPDMVDALSMLVAQEFRAIAEDGPTEAELNRSKAQIKAGLLMALESTSVRAEQMARHIIANDRLVEMTELVDQVSAVTGERIRDLAALMLESPATVTVVGSGRRSEAQAARAAALFAPLPGSALAVGA
jgi:predicted Zn-dependent peptidase